MRPQNSLMRVAGISTSRGDAWCCTRFRILWGSPCGVSSPPIRTNYLAHFQPRVSYPKTARVSHPSRTRRVSIPRGLRRPRARQKPGSDLAPLSAPPITRPAATAFPCSSSKVSSSARRARRSASSFPELDSAPAVREGCAHGGGGRTGGRGSKRVVPGRALPDAGFYRIGDLSGHASPSWAPHMRLNPVLGRR